MIWCVLLGRIYSLGLMLVVLENNIFKILRLSDSIIKMTNILEVPHVIAELLQDKYSSNIPKIFLLTNILEVAHVIADLPLDIHVGPGCDADVAAGVLLATKL